MKKILRFMRSMFFGVILLIVIAVLCILATALGMENIYQSWYFIALFGLLCVNLMLCSVLRVRGLGAQRRALMKRSETSELLVKVSDADRENWLKKHGFRQQTDGGYLRFGSGMYGSFVTHIALMLLLIAAVLNFTLAEKNNYSIPVGGDATLTDGTVLYIDGFSTADADGSTMYLSRLSATLPDGAQQTAETRVNYPARIGRYKVYQQNYGYTGVIGIRTSPEEEEIMVSVDLEMAQMDFAENEAPSIYLSFDGVNGISYYGMHTNVIEDEAGVTVAYSDEIVHPAYEVDVIQNGAVARSGLVFPGTTLEAGGVYYAMRDPVYVTGLCVKAQPAWTLYLLYLSFALMILGLYLCFFRVPVAASDCEEGIRLAGRKDIGDWFEQLTNDEQETKVC